MFTEYTTLPQSSVVLKCPQVRTGCRCFERFFLLVHFLLWLGNFSEHEDFFIRFFIEANHGETFLAFWLTFWSIFAAKAVRFGLSFELQSTDILAVRSIFVDLFLFFPDSLPGFAETLLCVLPIFVLRNKMSWLQIEYFGLYPLVDVGLPPSTRSTNPSIRNIVVVLIHVC